MSQFGFGISPELFNNSRFLINEADQLNNAWVSNMLQNSAQQAALAESRRRALEQEKLQRQAIKAQKDAQKKAQTNQWVTMGIGTAAGVGGGAALGGLAAAPAAGAAASPAIEAAAPATTGAIGATGVDAAAAPALSRAAAAQGASFGAAPVTPALGGGAVQPIGTAALGTPAPMQIPQLQPFAGGNVARGAALGGLLGGAGVLSGQNLLGPALQMPYQQFGAQLQGANTAANWANMANNQALGWSRLSAQSGRYRDQATHEQNIEDIQREANRIRQHGIDAPSKKPWWAEGMSPENLSKAQSVSAGVAPSANTMYTQEQTNSRFDRPSGNTLFSQEQANQRFDRPSGSTKYSTEHADIRAQNRNDLTMSLQGGKQDQLNNLHDQAISAAAAQLNWAEQRMMAGDTKTAQAAVDQAFSLVPMSLRPVVDQMRSQRKLPYPQQIFRGAANPGNFEY